VASFPPDAHRRLYESLYTNPNLDPPHFHPAERREQVERWLTQVIYRPGWEFSIADSSWPTYSGDVHIQVKAVLQDCYHPDRMVPVFSVQALHPSVKTFEDFCFWLSEALVKVEIHESQEWLRLMETKKPIFDPHKGEGEMWTPQLRRQRPEGYSPYNDRRYP
jgi:hypothetical protein